MNTFDSGFLHGLIKRCHQRGLSEHEATRVVDAALLRDPDVERGYIKRAGAAGLLDQARGWWNRQDPRVQGGLAGAGIGGLIPLLFGGEGRFMKALLGALLGGAAGAGGMQLLRQYGMPESSPSSTPVATPNGLPAGMTSRLAPAKPNWQPASFSPFRSQGASVLQNYTASLFGRPPVTPMTQPQTFNPQHAMLPPAAAPVTRPMKARSPQPGWSPYPGMLLN